MRREPHSYRADIDGWRAIAVAAVIAHHFDKGWLPGGYLGVDVFFVISGFVITLSLVDRKSEGFRAFIADFYARRMRRLLPALVVSVVATCVAIWLVDPAARQSLSTGLAALFGASNILLSRQDMDYFSPSTELNAFTHTWSLGVEEQFYLLFPLLLWSLARPGAQDARGQRRFVAVLSIASAASFVVFVATAQAYPLFNYYQLPARFWELALGALTFLAVRRWTPPRAQAAPLVAAAALAFAMLLPVEHRVFATTLAVAATIVLLAATPASPVLNSVMTNPALRFVGRISYPLYLWHWGVLVVSRFTIGVSAATAPAQVSVMLVLAWATWRYVESPVRRGFGTQPKWRVLTAGLCAALLGAAVPVTLRLNAELGPLKSAAGLAAPPDYLPLVGSGADFGQVCVIDGRKYQRKPDTIERCTAPPLTEGANMIWAFGDSHAGHLQPMLYGVREATGMGVHVIQVPNVPFPSPADAKGPTEGEKTFDAVSPRFRPGDVVLLGRLYLAREGAQRMLPGVAEWATEVGRLARRLEPRGVRVIVVAPLPVFRFATVMSCARSFFHAECALSRESLIGLVEEATGLVQEATRGLPNVSLFRPFDVLCPPDRETCTPFWDGKLAFRDMDHLNVVGAGALVEPFLRELGAKRGRGD